MHKRLRIKYTSQFNYKQVETESELQALCGDVFPRFVYASLDGRDVELVTGGQHVAVRSVAVMPFSFHSYVAAAPTCSACT